MNPIQYVLDLDAFGSSETLLATLAGVAALIALLTWLGAIGPLLTGIQVAVHLLVAGGFAFWRATLGWASWPAFLGTTTAVLGLGLMFDDRWPGVGLACGLLLVFLSVCTTLAYVYLDLERYEVARGRRALHNPLTGQALAHNLARYGTRAGAPLLIAATVGVVAGFALLNLGLYRTIAPQWYRMGEAGAEPRFADFLAYSLINLYNVVDLLHIASSYKYVHVSYVQQAQWPASTLLTLYKSFFTLILLQQVFASLRRGRLLSETISDFWSPLPPLSERARAALPQYGPGVVGPLLVSLRSIDVLTAEQREHLPRLLAEVGPAALPDLLRRLADSHEDVRGVAVAALGRLHAAEAVPALAALRDDASEWVRQCLAEALGTIGAAAPKQRRRVARVLGSPGQWVWRLLRRQPLAARQDPAAATLETLRRLLADPSAAVRRAAAAALGQLGGAASAATAELIGRLQDEDEAVRCRAAEALGEVGGDAGPRVTALCQLLEEPNAPLRVAAARALGAMRQEAAGAVPALVPLLHAADEEVRGAAADALSRIGVAPGAALDSLSDGLESKDNLVRAQTAEALGEIGASAASVAPALAEALTDENDRVRAKAAEALGRMGEAAADAVPELMRALRDQDNWVSALAAEALGEMGDSAAAAAPALVRSLGHPNPRVRANAADALGKLGPAANPARLALEAALADGDDAVRAAVLTALGLLGGLSQAARQAVLAAADDPNPEVRVAAIGAIGQGEEFRVDGGPVLLRALDDASETVRVGAAAGLPGLVAASASASAVEGLCKLLQDASPAVQLQAVDSLGQYGSAAGAAGPELARVARAGEGDLRVKALRAVALIQPPEATEAFRAGLKDPHAEVRMLAAAGMLKAPEVPPEAVPDVVAALRDPDARVRANATRLLLRIRPLPPEAVPGLIECAGDAEDGVRLGAARALRDANPAEVKDVFIHLLDDRNARVRLLAAGCLVASDPAHAAAAAVIAATLGEGPVGARRNALELVAALGSGAVAFQDVLRERWQVETDPALSARLLDVLEGLGQTVAVTP